MDSKISSNTQEKVVTGFDDPLLDRGMRQIESRRGSYGGKENSFEFIARRWTTWIKNNFDIDIEIQGWMVADMMADFKKGRAEARRAAGVEPHPDDREDEVAYTQWSEWLFPDHQKEVPFEDAETVDLDDDGLN